MDLSFSASKVNSIYSLLSDYAIDEGGGGGESERKEKIS
jgi:hypothetical protein